MSSIIKRRWEKPLLNSEVVSHLRVRAKPSDEMSPEIASPQPIPAKRGYHSK
ncbi:MAG: hypothetical protein HWN66_16795 [Candidatus Helarchaeota archaeon]|nr:hypothetical protein [Candidatus Helarchaeota archaeon]